MSAPILVVDDDKMVRESLRALLEQTGHTVHVYSSGKALLADDFAAGACLISDIRMPEMDGLQLQREIRRREAHLPIIFITAYADVPLAVEALKAGAVDFIEKPYLPNTLLQSVERALAHSGRTRSQSADAKAAQDALALLTPREREVFDRIVAGRPNKVAAYELQISSRTVEIHRAHIMDKMKARKLSDLIRISLVASTMPKDS